MSFIHQTTPRIHFGLGALQRLGDELKRFPEGPVLVVTDPGVLKAGIAEQAVKCSGRDCIIFSNIEPDPSIDTALACAKAARNVKASVIIGIGGGSAMDTAKVASIIAHAKQPIAEMFGVELVKDAGLPLILIPTTAGTGSEVTHIAILSDEQEHLKKGIVSAKLFPAVAIVDPELTLGVPKSVTAASGMDALLHAVEAFTSKNANSVTDTLAKRAMFLIANNLRTAFDNGSNVEARSAMLEGAMFAGMAFANAGVTAVHAFAYPIGAEFHIPHGVANSIMMGPVLTFNTPGNPKKFAEAGIAMGLAANTSAEGTIAFMKQLADDIQIPKHLADFGVRDEHIPGLASGVLKVTRLLANNPREVTHEDAMRLYREVL
ncbi:MAG: iron-containing alcohol dehydrogenase [Alphaproteobacteria bacterium]